MTASKPEPHQTQPERVTVELPAPTDFDARYTYYSTTMDWTDTKGPLTLTGGRRPGNRRVDRPMVSVGPDGARIEFVAQDGTYSSGAMRAFAAILLAAGRQLSDQERALDAAKAVVDEARFGPVPPLVPPVVLPRRKPRPAA